jgi:serine/threonine-protein kinase
MSGAARRLATRDLRGEHFGFFEVWGPIGDGGMSRVWLARHRALSIPVILKTLLAEGESWEAFSQLLNEARLMARIPSPRVVRAVDAGVHEGIPYLAQEYVDGIDLDELCRRRRQTLGAALPLWFVCRSAYEVADALHSAHQTGVLHRDVKPSNLFGAPQTGVRLGDFGIAVTRGLSNAVATGTPLFVAPETLHGEPIGRQCDIYSLGATAFNLRYGRPPFPSISDILGSQPPPFPPAPTAEEAYFQHVVRRMLERDPRRRFPTISAARRLLRTLTGMLTPPPTATSEGHGIYQLGPVRILCERGDIADAQVDGIVSSANDEMKMRTGVGEALRRRGGQVIEDEAMGGGGRALGECVVTGGGTLACRHVLHAVSAWKEASCIARTCQRAFLLAEELHLKSLALPALGTGVARVSPEASAYATASALLQHVQLGGTGLREVRFVLYDKETYDVFVDELNGVFLGDTEYQADTGELEGHSTEEVGDQATMYMPFKSR